MKDLLKTTLAFFVKLIVIFFGIQACFWAMNKASTIGNLVGFLGLVIIGVYFFYEVKRTVNKLNQDI